MHCARLLALSGSDTSGWGVVVGPVRFVVRFVSEGLRDVGRSLTEDLQVLHEPCVDPSGPRGLRERERERERENVAEPGLDCPGHRGHSGLCAALHALRLVRGLAALPVQV